MSRPNISAPLCHGIIKPEANNATEGSQEPETTVQLAMRLIALVLKDDLSMNDQDRLLALLDQDPQLVHQIGVTPGQLPDLVKNNPIVAISILLKLKNSEQITEYYNILVNMKMSLHSLEVVNRLTTSAPLPVHFIQMFISNCIITSDSIRDRNVQTRLVRLFCVYLQSVVRNGIIKVEELLIALETFCVRFRHIREVIVLRRLLSQLVTDRSNAAHYSWPYYVAQRKE